MLLLKNLRFFLYFTLFTTFSMITHSAPLTSKVIEQWMVSQQALEAWGAKHEATLAKHEEAQELMSPMDMNANSMIAPLKASGLYNEANTLVKKYGFANIDEWAEVTLRITKAAAAIEFKSQPELTDTSELEALLNNPQIAPQQKVMIQQALEQNKAMVNSVLTGTSESDMKAVKPMLNKILQLMEEPL